MPTRSNKICPEPGCHKKIPGNVSACSEHLKVNKGGFSGKRINVVREAFYKAKAWRVKRNAYIGLNPMCVMCAEEGVEHLADVVDHVKDWQEGGSKYGDDNLQSLCHSHHNRKTGGQASRKRGTITY